MSDACDAMASGTSTLNIKFEVNTESTPGFVAESLAACRDAAPCAVAVAEVGAQPRIRDD